MSNLKEYFIDVMAGFLMPQWNLKDKYHHWNFVEIFDESDCCFDFNEFRINCFKMAFKRGKND